MSNKRIWISLFFISIIIGTVFSENMITIYSHNPGDVGGGLVEIIDIDFYQDGMIKSVSSYRPGRSINTWEDDNGERDSLEIAWHFPQIEIVKNNSLIKVDSKYYNDTNDLEKVNSQDFIIVDLNKIDYILDPIRTYEVKQDGSFKNISNGDLVCSIFNENELSKIEYLFTKHNDHYIYTFTDIYREYSYYELDDENSRFEYKIEYAGAGLYKIFSYNSTDPERIFVHKYILKAQDFRISEIANFINFAALPSRFRPLLPFFTISIVTNPDLIQSK